MRLPILLGSLLLACAATCAAQQFHVERDFDVLRRADGRPLNNVYWVSLPLRPYIADAANSAATQANKCVGDYDGPAVGDGLINADDLICAWWTSRANMATSSTFSLSKIDPQTCTPVTRNGLPESLIHNVTFTGTLFDIEPGAGYQVLVSVPSGATYSPRNHAVIEGDHDDTWTGRDIIAAPTCPTGAPNCCGATAPRYDLISVPYHVLYTHADEILCGLEGVDWQDADGNGLPDTCWDDADGDGRFDVGERPTGVFDGRVAILAGTWLNNEAVNGVVPRVVTIALGRLRFAGTNFALTAGEAYRLQLSLNHTATLFLPPHS